MSYSQANTGQRSKACSSWAEFHMLALTMLRGDATLGAVLKGLSLRRGLGCSSTLVSHPHMNGNCSHGVGGALFRAVLSLRNIMLPIYVILNFQWPH